MTTSEGVLNAVQVEVLAWVREGCPEGVYGDWSHRITARALHNRGLILVHGRGASWTASITAQGTVVLDDIKSSGDEDARVHPSAARLDQVGEAMTDSPTAGADTPDERAKPPRKVGPAEQLLLTLQAAPEHLFWEPRRDEARYRQLVGVAKRFDQVPAGMYVSFSRRSVAGERMLQIQLAPLPAWHGPLLSFKKKGEAALASDVARQCAADDSFPVAGIARSRALRLLDAFVIGASEGGMRVRWAPVEVTPRPGYAPNVPDRNAIHVVIGEDDYVVSFLQGILQVAHEPTEREIARARRGYLFPDFDEVPDPQLRIRLHGPGAEFWAGQWKDTATHSLEQDLLQILEEIRLRHESAIWDREDQRQRQLEQERSRMIAQEEAAKQQRQRALLEAMRTEAARWAEATELRAYRQAVLEHAVSLGGVAGERARDWAAQISARADARSRVYRTRLIEVSSWSLATCFGD